jgi:hypothetical protein
MLGQIVIVHKIYRMNKRKNFFEISILSKPIAVRHLDDKEAQKIHLIPFHIFRQFCKRSCNEGIGSTFFNDYSFSYFIIAR